MAWQNRNLCPRQTGPGGAPPGYPPTHQKEKILPNPSFTTPRPTDQGNGGCGLVRSYRIIVKAHGGEIKSESKEGEGECFPKNQIFTHIHEF